MDIYILHEGQESGPYSEKAVAQLLDQGSITSSDLAWRTGLSEWVPVSELLAAKPATPLPGETPAPPSAGKEDAATPKQKALLGYLRIVFPADLSRDQASRLINDAMEDPKNTERLTLWNVERLRLHPDLFAAELQAKKENRANHFFELCQTAGADYFQEITKAHCQVLVSFLDVKFPHWDARESEAAEHYFYPAVAEKFPQLVQKQWRGRLHYAEGNKIAPEMVHKSAASKSRRNSTSPLAAITRGFVLGIVILGVLYLGYRTLQQDVTAAPAEVTTSVVGERPPGPTALPTAELRPVPAADTASAIASTAPSQELVPPAPAGASMPAPADPATAPVPGVPRAASSVPEPPLPVAGEPGPPPAPMAATPPAPMAADSVPPPAGVPPPAATDPAGMAMNPAAVNTAPMASLPGSEPPVPLPPPPATLPVAGTLPSLPPEAYAIPPLPPTPESPGMPAVPAVSGPVAKTNLLLTKPVEIQLAYGKIMLPPGTAVKLVSRQGGILKVSYRASVISVPATSTDLE